MAVAFRLLLITDGSVDPVQLTALLAALPRGQVGLQLRNRSLDGGALFRRATELRALTAASGTALLINDRVDIALAVGADGVHLPGHGLSVAAARQLIGGQRLLSVATHSLAEVFAQASAGADCVTFGPIWPTPSKPHAEVLPASARVSPVGIAQLAAVVAASPIPLFALGGVDSVERAAACAAVGARVAALRGVLAAADPPATALAMLTALAAL